MHTKCSDLLTLQQAPLTRLLSLSLPTVWGPKPLSEYLLSADDHWDNPVQPQTRLNQLPTTSQALRRTDPQFRPGLEYPAKFGENPITPQYDLGCFCPVESAAGEEMANITVFLLLNRKSSAGGLPVFVTASELSKIQWLLNPGWRSGILPHSFINPTSHLNDKDGTLKELLPSICTGRREVSRYSDSLQSPIPPIWRPRIYPKYWPLARS